MLSKSKIRRVLTFGLGAGLIGSLSIALAHVGIPVTVQENKGRDSQVISGKEFQLVDQHGKARAVLALSEEGEPYLSMTGRNGIAVVWLGIAGDSGLAIRDAWENPARLDVEFGRTTVACGEGPPAQDTFFSNRNSRMS